MLKIAIDDAANPHKALVDAKIKEGDPNPTKFEWGEIVGNVKVYACHKAQLDILRSDAKYTFAFAGTGGGKTALTALWLFKRIKEKPKGRFLVVSPTNATFESSQLKQHLIDAFSETEYEGQWLEQKKTYKLPTEGEIIVRTAERDAKRLTGGQYDAIVLDECWLLDKAVWEEIRRRSNIRSAPILGVTTPNVNGWLFSDIQQEYDRGNKDYYVRRWATDQNPVKSADEHKRFLESERLLLGEAQFNRMYRGEFAAFEGLVYECFGDEKSTKFPVLPLNKLPSVPVRFFGGIDWGYSPDPAVMLIFAECEDGITYCVDEFYETKITPDRLAATAHDLIAKWAISHNSKYADISGGTFTSYYCDRSRPEAAAMVRMGAVPIQNNKISEIVAGVATVDSWFRSGRLKVFPCCKNLIREAKGYSWDKTRGGGLKDQPRSGNDHALDALRYAIASHKYNVPLEPIIKIEPTEAETLDKLKLYGLDPANEIEEARRKRENDRFWAIAFDGLED